MIDGFDIAYYEATDMPNMKKMAKEGFFKKGSAIFPTLTNANNISIACGAWPEKHGVTTNCYYDREADKAFFLEHPSFLQSPTIFEKAALTGKKSALLTCKSKTAKIIGHMADIAIAAEEPDMEICRKFGTPPPMYSSEINYWLMKTAIKIADGDDAPELIYIHTTDYPMHMWSPEDSSSQEHMKTIDSLLGEFHKTAPDYAILLTADHGMNYKKRCYDLAKSCSSRGTEIKYAVSPVADRLLKHHGGFGGVSYVYLINNRDRERVIEALLSIDGVEEVLDRETAASRFSLMDSRIGDLVVIPDRHTVFGDLPEEYTDLPAGYRSHGSLYEMDIPLLMFNLDTTGISYKDINYNLDLTNYLFGAKGE